MPKKQAIAYPLRLPDDYMDKLRHVAKENGRSVNKEIEVIVKNHIADFEAKNGTINLEVE